MFTLIAVLQSMLRTSPPFAMNEAGDPRERATHGHNYTQKR